MSPTSKISHDPIRRDKKAIEMSFERIWCEFFGKLKNYINELLRRAWGRIFHCPSGKNDLRNLTHVLRRHLWQTHCKWAWPNLPNQKHCWIWGLSGYKDNPNTSRHCRDIVAWSWGWHCVSQQPGTNSTRKGRRTQYTREIHTNPYITRKVLMSFFNWCNQLRKIFPRESRKFHSVFGKESIFH